MKKIGYREIVDKGEGAKKAKCLSCGAEARKVVTFQGEWLTLRVALCNKCAMKPYEELRLQRTIEFAVVA